jgi:hypothetical protein
MAVDVLMHKMHERKYDLESFYWLLIWTLLPRADHDQGPSACSKLFDVEDRELTAAQKEHLTSTFRPAYHVQRASHTASGTVGAATEGTIQEAADRQRDHQHQGDIRHSHGRHRLRSESA